MVAVLFYDWPVMLSWTLSSARRERNSIVTYSTPPVLVVPAPLFEINLEAAACSEASSGLISWSITAYPRPTDSPEENESQILNI